MKKLFIAMLSTLMMVMMFAACGNDAEIKGATEASQGSTAAAPATTTTAATKKSEEGDDSIDGGVVIDKEGGADDAQDIGGE